MALTCSIPFGHIHHISPWQIPYKAHNVLCPDGYRRSAHNIASGPDTYFSLVATIKVRGKSVRGYLTSIDNNGHDDIAFVPYWYCKNHAAFQHITT